MADNDSIISAVRGYMDACPVLDGLTGGVHIDWTAADPTSYGIFPDGDTTIKQYADGGTKRQYSFGINSRRMAMTDAQRLANSEFLENLQSWCAAQNLIRGLPSLPDGMEALRIEALTGMVLETDAKGKSAIYTVGLRLTYTKRR